MFSLDATSFLSRQADNAHSIGSSIEGSHGVNLPARGVILQLDLIPDDINDLRPRSGGIRGWNDRQDHTRALLSPNKPDRPI